jgi:hypothetical protein
MGSDLTIYRKSGFDTSISSDGEQKREIANPQITSLSETRREK